ncbi:MAG: ATP-binding protein [Halorubrum sp.]
MEIAPRADVESPWLLWALTVVLGVALVAEGTLLAVGTVSIPDGYWVGALSSVLVVFGFGYAASRIPASELSPGRYSRLVRWCFVGSSGFLLINVGFIATLPTASTFQIVGWVRWAISFGAGIGLVIGVFEARAIEREVVAERIALRQSELQRERDRLEEFASVVSHDLRNPLNVVRGRVGLATERHPDDEHLAAIRSPLDRMDEIIEETLTLAREGKTVDETTDVDLAACARECWSRVDTGRAALRAEGELTVRADRDRLSHVLENLFRNAVEHGGADVTVRVGPLDGREGFYVEDDGAGIPEDERDRVFDPGETSSRDGNGFGLAIVERIVDAHGWNIAITDGEDGGARFEIDGIDRQASD